jgi:atypical dual specificity phosphatase
MSISAVDMFGVPTKAQLERGLAFIAGIEQENGSVYVHCKAGRVRSATLVGYYLMSKYNLTPEAAADMIRRKRSQILITPKSLSCYQPETS